MACEYSAQLKTIRHRFNKVHRSRMEEKEEHRAYRKCKSYRVTSASLVYRATPKPIQSSYTYEKKRKKEKSFLGASFKEIAIIHS
jgi:hypothetical protein